MGQQRLIDTRRRTQLSPLTVPSPPSAAPLEEDKFNVELVVQCIRTSDVPQTHHHALLLLATAAAIFPVSEIRCTAVVSV